MGQGGGERRGAARTLLANFLLRCAARRWSTASILRCSRSSLDLTCAGRSGEVRYGGANMDWRLPAHAGAHLLHVLVGLDHLRKVVRRAVEGLARVLELGDALLDGGVRGLVAARARKVRPRRAKWRQLVIEGQERGRTAPGERAQDELPLQVILRVRDLAHAAGHGHGGALHPRLGLSHVLQLLDAAQDALLRAEGRVRAPTLCFRRAHRGAPRNRGPGPRTLFTEVRFFAWDLAAIRCAAISSESSDATLPSLSYASSAACA